MPWRWVGRTQPDGSPAEYLNGFPAHDLTDEDVAEVAATTGWTLDEVTALLEAATCFEAGGSAAPVAGPVPAPPPDAPAPAG